nr:hypothetical protein [Tanacetum cinerariifolium]
MKPRRKVTKVPQPSDPTSVTDEAVNEEMDDSLERVATTATSLDAEQDKGVNTPQSGEDSLKLTELMELCTKLQQRVFDLDTTKTTQALEIESLKRRVKKLERRKRSRTHGLIRLYKVGLSTRVESFEDEGLGKEDASKQERIADIDSNEDIYLVNVHKDKDIFGVNDLDGDEVIVKDADMLFDVADDLRGEEEDASKQREIIANIDADENVILKDVAAVEKTADIEENADVQGRKRDVKNRKIEFAYTYYCQLKVSAVKSKFTTVGDGYCLWVEGMDKNNAIFVNSSHKKKVFSKMKIKGNEFSGRLINNIDQDVEITLVDDTRRGMNKEDMFRVNDLDGDKVVVDASDSEKLEQSVKVVEKDVSTTDPVTNAGEVVSTTDIEVTTAATTPQRLEEKYETTELKKCLEIIPKDDDDVTIKATPISSKSPTIFYYKIYKEGKKSYLKIIRANGNSQSFLTFGKMFKNFNIKNLEVLWSIIKARFKKTKPIDDMDNMLFQTLKTMFEHQVEDNTWKYQQGTVKVLHWKLFYSCEVYYVTTQNMVYYLLVENMYLFTRKFLLQMWNDVRLQVDYEVEMAYDLLILIRKQINEGYVPE